MSADFTLRKLTDIDILFLGCAHVLEYPKQLAETAGFIMAESCFTADLTVLFFSSVDYLADSTCYIATAMSLVLTVHIVKQHSLVQ